MKDKDIHEKEIAEHNYRHINKIIGDQYGCQQALWISEQTTDFLIRGMITWLYFIEVGRR